MGGRFGATRALVLVVGVGLLLLLGFWLRPVPRVARTRSAGSEAAGAPQQVERAAAATEHVAPSLKRDRYAADAVRAQLAVIRARTAVNADTSAKANPGAVTAGLPAVSAVTVATTPQPRVMPAPVGSGNQAHEAMGKYIQETVHGQFYPMAGGCYDELLARQPKARGKLDLSIAVAGDPSVGGVVERVEVLPDSTLTDPSFLTCMTESMMAVQFDAPPAPSGRVDFVYPFELAPDDPNAQAPDAQAAP
jgi:hypothetical protein